MEITRRPHQQRIRDLNPNRAMLVWAPRTGKSLGLQEWINDPIRVARSYIICLKKNKKEWEARCPDTVVMTKEEFRKNPDIIVDPTAIGVDECHHFHSPLFIAKKRSQLATALYTILKKYPHVHFMGLSGTPLTNDPASVHTLLVYLGKYIPWGEFQNRFYELKYMPFLPRPAYFPIKNWREPANELLKQYTDIVSLHDCADWLPPEIKEVVELKTKPKVYAEDEEYHWTKDHKHEQSEKAEKIKEIGEGYRKVLVVCHYTEQIDDLARKLKLQKPVFVLDGRTKNQAAVIKEAQDSLDCFFIVQAAMGEGFDGYQMDCMVFASMDHTVRHHTQMLSRLVTLEKHLMKPTIYIYLIGGKWDRHIYESVMAGEDFNPHRYEK